MRSTPAARPTDLQKAHDEPDRDDDHGTKQKIAKGRAKRIEAQIQNTPDQLLNPVDQVERRDAEHRKDDADHDGDQDQADQSARHTVPKELLPVHAAVLSHAPCAAAPASRLTQSWAAQQAIGSGAEPQVCEENPVRVRMRGKARAKWAAGAPSRRERSGASGAAALVHCLVRAPRLAAPRAPTRTFGKRRSKALDAPDRANRRRQDPGRLPAEPRGTGAARSRR